MPTPSNHSFNSAFPFEIKIENQFMNEGHSTFYIVNKVDAEAFEQQVKLQVNSIGPSDYTLKGFGFVPPAKPSFAQPAKGATTAPANCAEADVPGPAKYNLAIAVRPGVLLDSVAQSFSQTLYTSIDDALGTDNTCTVHGPITRSDKALVWYVTFQKDLIAKGATQPIIEWIPEKEEAAGLKLTRLTIAPDGRRYGIDTDHKLYIKSSDKGNWEPSSWSWEIESIALLSNGSVFYASLDGSLIWGGSEAGEQSFWIPVQPPTVIRSISLKKDGQLIGINQHGHLIRVDLILNPTSNLNTAITNTTSILDTSIPLISVCTLPDGQILGVDTQHDLRVWDETTKRWTLISSPTKLLDIAVDTSGNILAVGTDHEIYRQSLTYTPENVLNISLKGVSAAAGTGARSSQIACQFGKVQLDGNPHDFHFKATTQLNIVNHQGAGYAPLHFGVMGNDVMVKEVDNTLKVYFITKERIPLKIDKTTIITFAFPYQNAGKQTPFFGTSNKVNAYSAKQPTVFQHISDPAQPTDTQSFKAKNDPDRHQVIFTFQGKEIAQVLEEVFVFDNIQISSYQGPVIVEVSVSNFPGYWDSVFQIPVVVGTSALTSELMLGEVAGTSGKSRISFLTSNNDEKVSLVKIEEDNGLNLFGTKDKPVSIKGTNLLVPEGKVVIGMKGIDQPSNADLYVDGKVQIYGSLLVGPLNNPGLSFSVDNAGNMNTLNFFAYGPALLRETLEVQKKATFRGTTILNGPITTENKDEIVTFSHHVFANGWIGSHGTTYVRGHLAVGKADKPEERFHVDEPGNVTVGKGDLTAISGKTTVKELRIEGGDPHALSIGGKGLVQVDYPKIAGGRFKIDNAGNVTIGKGILTANNNATIHGNAQVFGLLYVGNKTNHNASLTVDDGGNVNTFNLLTHGQATFHQKVGIGITNPIAPLHVNGEGPNATKGGMYFDEYRHVEGYNVEGEQQVSILAKESILSRRFIANSYAAHSDVRIKKCINPSDKQQDLSKLLQVKIRNYTYVDFVKNSSKNVNGVIAQELEKTFPEAVSKMSEFIPDIYQICNQLTVNLELKELSCELEKPHGLKVGDKVKLIKESDQEYFNEVIAVKDARGFTVKNWEEKVEKVFIYGKEVDDFRTVDYNQVSMIGISAIQVMHQAVDTLKEENAVLKAGQDRLQETYESLKGENMALRNQLENEMQSLRAEMEALQAKAI